MYIYILLTIQRLVFNVYYHFYPDCKCVREQAIHFYHLFPFCSNALLIYYHGEVCAIKDKLLYQMFLANINKLSTTE